MIQLLMQLILTPILNNYILNPAVAGIENYKDVKLSYRNQWAGIDGAPVTTYFSIHGPIGKTDYKTSATSFEVPGKNPRGKQFSDHYTAADAHHAAAEKRRCCAGPRPE